jgi:NADH-quinone oxidoreductase subunit G
LMRLDRIEPGSADDVRKLAARGGKVEKSRLEGSVEDYYLTNPVARASAVMAECSRLARGQMLNAAE